MMGELPSSGATHVMIEFRELVDDKFAVTPGNGMGVFITSNFMAKDRKSKIALGIQGELVQPLTNGSKG